MRPIFRVETRDDVVFYFMGRELRDGRTCALRLAVPLVEQRFNRDLVALRLWEARGELREYVNGALHDA